MRPARLSGRRPGGMAGLRMRLTAVCALFTTAVLAAALWAGWAMARQQYLTSADALLAGSLDSLLEKLEAGGPVSDRFLAELELRSRAVVYLLDNGRPLQFAGAWQPATPREALAARALTAAGGEGICWNGTPGRRWQTPLELTGLAGDGYTGYAARPAAPEGVLVLLLQDTTARQAALTELAARYGALGLAGALALGLTAWLLAGAAIRPTARAVARQREFVAAASHELRTPLAAVSASLEAAGLALGAGGGGEAGGAGGSPAPDRTSAGGAGAAAGNAETAGSAGAATGNAETAGGAETAESAAPSPAPDPARFLQAAGQETRRMARLVDDLLLLAGSDAAAWQLRPARVSLDEVCRAAYEQFLPLAQAAGRRLTLLLEDAPAGDAAPPPAPEAWGEPEVWGDEERLVQLLGVLLSNALEYAPPGSAVELILRRRGGRAAVLVRDHGPGVPDADKERIFARFYRAEQSRTDHAHFGLGLAVASELARLHGARLSVRDTLNARGEPDGATFVLELRLL